MVSEKEEVKLSGPYAKARVNEHEVEHLFSGKSHHFRVSSKNGVYNVSINAVCECRYFSVQGASQGRFCSHILAVLKKVLETSEVEE